MEVTAMFCSSSVIPMVQWSAYLSPRPLRQVSSTRMPYVPGQRKLQTRRIRWWGSLLHKQKWHPSSSCCGTCCMKTKQRVHPMPQRGSRISEWLHPSKPTRTKHMWVIIKVIIKCTIAIHVYCPWKLQDFSTSRLNIWFYFIWTSE